MSAHDLLLLAHLLLFAYWLGGDLGVFYTSGFVVDETLPANTRLTAARIMLHLDLVPRICMALTLTVGGILNHYVGVEHYPLQMAAIVALGPVWLGLVLLNHHCQGTPAAPRLARIDLVFRWFLVAAVFMSVGYARMTGSLDAAPWIAAKLVIFAGLVLLGIGIRIQLRPFVAALGRLAGGEATDDDNRVMRESLARVRPLVLLIWVGLVAASVLGIVKPGSP